MSRQHPGFLSRIKPPPPYSPPRQGRASFSSLAFCWTFFRRLGLSRTPSAYPAI
nr:MAG TPA: hypothetical protein [Caudoviricetes sp.]